MCLKKKSTVLDRVKIGKEERKGRKEGKRGRKRKGGREEKEGRKGRKGREEGRKYWENHR